MRLGLAAFITFALCTSAFAGSGFFSGGFTDGVQAADPRASIVDEQRYRLNYEQDRVSRQNRDMERRQKFGF